MFELNVLKSFTHPDGRIFMEGHDCKALSIFEAAELLLNFPDNFKPANGVTEELAANKEAVEKYANAKK